MSKGHQRSPLHLLRQPNRLLYSPLRTHHYRQRHLTPQKPNVAILLELAEHQPVLCILEDLHWTDPTTLELLNLVIEQTPTASIFVLLTCRPYFQPAWHHRSYLTEITVNRLSHAQVEQIITRMTDGKTFPQEVFAQIVEKTDGVPLYVEEMTKAILESGQLKAFDGHYELIGSFSTLTIPATLHDSLMARLDRLISAKGIAQLGAAIGRQFAYDLLQAVSQLDEITLRRELSRLVEAEIVYQRGVPPQATYTFKHALIQDAAYQSFLKSTRQHYHQRIAQVLEAQFPETAETQPGLLAQHSMEAGLAEKAVHYWYQAGQRAIQRSAHVEAIAHFHKGLGLLQTLPETPERLQHAVDLLIIALGASLLATQGYRGSGSWGDLHACTPNLPINWKSPQQTVPRAAWTLELLSHTRRVSDGVRTWRATPCSWHSRSKTLPCLWRRTVPWGRRYSNWGCNRCTHALCTGHRTATTPSSTVSTRSSMGTTLAWFAAAMTLGCCGTWAILTRD